MTPDQRAANTRSRVVGLIAAGSGIAVGTFVAQFVRDSLAEAAGYSTGVVIFVGYVLWAELQRRVFWWFMTTVVIAHGIALLLVPWPLHHDMNKGDMLFGLGDLLLVGSVGLLVRRLSRRSGSNSATT